MCYYKSSLFSFNETYIPMNTHNINKFNTVWNNFKWVKFTWNDYMAHSAMNANYLEHHFKRTSNGKYIIFSTEYEAEILINPSVLVALVDLVVRSFPWFSQKFAWIRARIPWKDPHGGHSPYRLRSHKRTIGLIPTTTTTTTTTTISFVCQK